MKQENWYFGQFNQGKVSLANKTDTITQSETNEAGKVGLDGLRQMKLEREPLSHSTHTSETAKMI